MEKIASHDLQRIVLLADSLECVTSSGLRTLLYVEQKFGADVETYVVGAKPNVQKFLEFSSLCRSIKLVEQYEDAGVAVTV